MFYLLSRGEPTQQIWLKPPKIIFMKLNERLISPHHQFSPVHLEKQASLKLTDALHLATFAVTLWKKEI